jgi:hypothetical protein
LGVDTLPPIFAVVVAADGVADGCAAGAEVLHGWEVGGRGAAVDFDAAAAAAVGGQTISTSESESSVKSTTCLLVTLYLLAAASQTLLGSKQALKNKGSMFITALA